MSTSRSAAAFTLLELLVVIAVIAALASLLLPCLAGARQEARRIEEQSAARQLLLAVQMYGDDHHGAMFPGYVADGRVVDDRGQSLAFPINARYPWRIAPYLSGSMESIYIGENRGKLARLRTRDHAAYVYGVSVSPSLGINSYFLGGNDTEFPAVAANAKFGGGTVVTRWSEIHRPAELLGFASARSATGGIPTPGYYQVTPPYVNGRQWDADYADSQPPKQWGYVAPRYQQRAVVALLDGHTAAFDLRALQDMRHWCNRAERADWKLLP